MGRDRAWRVRALVVGAVAVALACIISLLDNVEESRRAEPSDGPADSGASDASSRTSVPPASPGLPPRPSVTAATIRIFGRVVAKGRAPVPGASVSVSADGARLAAGTTTGGGSFALDARAGPDQVLVVVHDAGGGRARRLGFRVPPGARELDTGAIFLTPARELVVRVTADGAPVAGARVVIGPESAGTFVAEAEATTGADGSAAVDAVTRTRLVAYATAVGHGRGRGVAERDDAEVIVSLGPERVVEVEVVDADTGAPVPAARFDVCEARGTRDRLQDEPCVCLAAAAPTDTAGRTAIRGLENDVALAIRAVRAPGYPALPPDARIVVPAGARHVRIELPPPRTLRWAIDSWGDAPVPPDGARVRLRPRAVDDPFAPGLEHAEGRIEGGTLVVDGLPPHSLGFVVETEAGHVAGVRAPDAAGDPKPVVFFFARSARVRVHDANGPVVGVGIVARLRGASRAMIAPVLTDARGVAVLDGLFPYPSGEPPDVGFGVARVECLPFAPSRDGCRDVGSIDLRRVRHDLDVVLAPEEEVVLAVSIGGRPALPSWYSIEAGGVRTEPVAEDAATGTIRLRARRVATDAPWPLRFVSPGHPPATIDLNDARGPAVIDLH